MAPNLDRAAPAHDAHCLHFDYERARQIAPYGDEDNVRLLTRAIVQAGGAVLQTHKLATNDRDHIDALLSLFDPPAGAHVLDAGCGVGAVAALMAAVRPDLQFSLLNVSAAQLEMAPASMRKIHADFQQVPVDAASFDAVMFNYSLGHGLLDACIAETARILRPGGVLFIYDLTTDDHAHVIPLVGYRPHARGEVEAAALRHGFINCQVIDNPPTSTADYCRMFGADVLERHGLDRAWPIIYRFRRPHARADGADL